MGDFLAVPAERSSFLSFFLDIPISNLHDSDGPNPRSYAPTSEPNGRRGMTGSCRRALALARDNMRRHGLTAKTESSASRETPRDSGWKRTQTTTVRAEHVPKRKYGPEDDFARKRGVEKAMIQFTTYNRHISTT